MNVNIEKKINNYKLYLSLNSTGKKYCETDKKKTRLVLKPQKNLIDLFNEFNNFSDQNKNQGKVSNCKYYDLYLQLVVLFYTLEIIFRTKQG